MRITYYSEHCPCCGKLVYYDTSERELTFGNTMAVCEHCGKEYLDGKVYEWVNLNNEQKKAILVFGHDIVLITEADIRKAYSLSKHTKFLLLTLPIVSKQEKQLKMLEDFRFKPEMLQNPYIQESIARTSNQEYLQTLLRMGRNYYGEGFES